MHLCLSGLRVCSCLLYGFVVAAAISLFALGWLLLGLVLDLLREVAGVSVGVCKPWFGSLHGLLLGLLSFCYAEDAVLGSTHGEGLQVFLNPCDCRFALVFIMLFSSKVLCLIFSLFCSFVVVLLSRFRVIFCLALCLLFSSWVCPEVHF